MRQSNYVPRGIIIFLQVLGTIFAVIGLLIYIVFMGDISDAIGSSDPESKAITALILGFLVYLTWKTIYTAIVIIRFIKASSDDDILANRYIISALSLNLGGLMTPFIMSMLPNVATRSTINPRWFLSRVMGITSLVGAPLGFIAFIASALTGTGALTSQQLFDTSVTSGIIGTVMLVAAVIITLFGLLTAALFYQKSSHQIFDQGNTNFTKSMNVVAIIWLVVITVELLLTMLLAVIRLLGAILDLFKAISSDGAGRILYLFAAIFNLIMTFYYVSYVLYLTSRAMVGIWAKDGVEYKPYENLIRAQKNAQNRNFG